MRTTLFIFSVATLLSVMCADISDLIAAPQSRDSREPLIDRMTRNRKPDSSTPSTSQSEEHEDSVIPVRRVPVSEVRVEVDSRPLSDLQSLEVQALIPSEWDMLPQHDIVTQGKVSKPLVDAAPGQVAKSEPRTSQELPLAAEQEEQPRSTKTVAVPKQPPEPSFSGVPEITFDPLYEEHTLQLPDTTDDGFVGVPRSQRDVNGNYDPVPGGRLYHDKNSQPLPAQPQRVFPGFRRRFR